MLGRASRDARRSKMTTFFKNLFLQFDTGVIYTIRFSSTSWFQICIYFDLFKVTRGHQRSLKGQNRRIMVETEPISRNIFKIHMFRLKILWRIQIQNYWGQIRSPKVIKGQISVKTVELRSNWVDKSQYIQYTYVSPQNFVKKSNSKLFEVNSGHQRSK